ncbi:MAG: metallopeptidase family protein [Candidatus Latescibacterota bacterium]
MRRREFQRLAERALERIPRPFRQAMANVAVVVEDWPDSDLMEEVTGDPDAVLYGLFDGTALPDRSLGDPAEVPAVIRLYQGPLEEDFPDLGELAREIEVTLVHEIAHFMGLDEDAIREYGYE